MINWRARLEKKSNTTLFELFSETYRINIEPQLYAGKLLYERGYDFDKLNQAKTKLIDALEEQFKRKYYKDEKNIAKETVIRELFIRIFISALVFYSFYTSSDIQFEQIGIRIDGKIAAWTLALVNLVPFLWIKKTIKKSIDKVQSELEKKDLVIQRIRTELKF